MQQISSQVFRILRDDLGLAGHELRIVFGAERVERVERVEETLEAHDSGAFL